jgi:predicted transglutaminase-like cysteine proteinase
MKLTEIIGLEQKHADLLQKAGISETEDLLPLTHYQIQQMARSIGVSVKTLDTWQEHADLMRIDGITPQLANAINLIGIDSVKEFAQRNTKTTVAKLKELKSEKPKVLTKVPTEKEVQKWKDQAIVLEGTQGKKPSTPKTPAKTPAKTPSDSSELPVQPKLIEIKPFEKDYGEFGPEYWNNKWEEAPIIYTGRALRGKFYDKQIDADVKVFIKKNDAILHHVISQLNLYKGTANETAWMIQRFVCDFLKYTDDDVTVDCPEYWMFPFETIQSEVGDCEDGAILIASLLVNAGIPAWRVKVCAAQVMADPIVAPADDEGELGGHAYCIYLADRPESERKLEWVILDWCYLQDPEIAVEEKPLARDGGQEGAYRNIWFSFNNEKSWAQTAFEVTSPRISNHQTSKMDDVIGELLEVTRILAEEEIDKLIERLKFTVE